MIPPTSVPFDELIRRVRAGDNAARSQVVREYERPLRLLIRHRLSDPRVRRGVDSGDVVQDVFGSFFSRITAGRFTLESEDDLRRLLMVMAYHKALRAVERELRAYHGPRSLAGTPADGHEPADPSPGPSEAAEWNDFVRYFRSLLTEREQRVLDLFLKNCTWPEIAEQLQTTPDACRMAFHRAIERVVRLWRLSL